MASHVCQCVAQDEICPHLQPENRPIGKRGIIFLQTSSKLVSEQPGQVVALELGEVLKTPLLN